MLPGGHSGGGEFARDRAPVGDTQRRLEAPRQALADVGMHAQAVDHDVAGVFLGHFQRRQRVGLEHRARLPAGADTDANEALRLRVLDQALARWAGWTLTLPVTGCKSTPRTA